MLNLNLGLKNKLKGAKSVAIVGIGSELRQDDAAGIAVAKKLRSLFRGKAKYCRVKVFIGANTPENLTGQIRKFSPSHLLIIDAAHMGKRAGEIRLLDSEDINIISCSTHSLPIKVILDYLLANLVFQVIIIGIEPKEIDFGSSLSKVVAKAVKRVVEAVKEAVRKE